MTEEAKMVKVTPLGETAMAQEAADMFGVPPMQLINLIKMQIITVPRDDPPPTDAELALVLSTIKGSGLNPLMGQTYAWRDNHGKMAIHISPDGWAKIQKDDKDIKYVTVEESTEVVRPPDGKGQDCPAWMRAVITTKDGEKVPMEKAWLKEWYVTPYKGKPGPWQDQTNHRLYIVAYRLGIRFFTGLVGVSMDEEQPHYQQQRDQGAMTDQKTSEMVKILPDDTEVEDAMVDAMAGEAPSGPVDESITEDDDDVLPALDDDAPRLLGMKAVRKCDVPDCKLAGTTKCGSCGQMFCLNHVSEDPDRCRVCFDGGG